MTRAGSKQEVVLRAHIELHEDTEFRILGGCVRDKTGTEIIETSTDGENVLLPPRRAGRAVAVEHGEQLPLARGTYSVTTVLAYERYSSTYFDLADNALALNVRDSRRAR